MMQKTHALHNPVADNSLPQATGGKDMSSGGFAARAQSAGDRNQNASQGTNSGGGYGGNSGNQSGTKK